MTELKMQFETGDVQERIDQLKRNIEDAEGLNGEIEERLMDMYIQLAEAQRQLSDAEYQRPIEFKKQNVSVCEEEIDRLLDSANRNRASIQKYREELNQYGVNL